MNHIQNKAALPKDLKRKNRKEILKAFQNSEKEEWTLAEVSDFTGISRATVSKAVMSFVQKGILIYRGKGNSTEIGGKKPDVFAFNQKYHFVAYLNIGLEKLTMTFLDLKFKEQGKTEVLVPAGLELQEMIDKSCQCLEQLVMETGISKDRLYGLCISTSGMVNQETGVLQCNLSYSHWGSEIPLKDIFQEKFPELVIMVENVARASGRAELYYNRGLEDKKLFTVFTYRGISGCLIDKGKVQNSRNSLIGEIGHMIICPDEAEACRCGSKGCFEQMVSEEKICSLMRSDTEKWKGSSLSAKPHAGLKDILEEANLGDAYACELADKTAWYFAMAFRNVILTVDPEVIIIQGNYSSGGEYFKNKLKEFLYNQAYFPKTSDWTFLYNNRDIWKLAEIGLSAAMADDLFQNRELYKD